MTATESGRRLQVPYDNYFNTALQLNHGSRRHISAECFENQYYCAKSYVIEEFRNTTSERFLELLPLMMKVKDVKEKHRIP